MFDPLRHSQFLNIFFLEAERKLNLLAILGIFAKQKLLIYCEIKTFWIKSTFEDFFYLV